jgi:hypothetical protein
MAKASDNVFPKVIHGLNTSDPTAPSDSSWKVYAKPGGIYARSSNSVVGPFGTGGGGGDYTGVPWSSGTSMPGSPSTNDRVTRTDLGLDFYYDGTRWLTTTLFEVGSQWASALSTSNTDLYVAPVDSTWGIYIVSFDVSTFVISTNNGSNYWTVALQRANTSNTASTIDSFTTAADTVSNWTQHKETVGAVLDASARVLLVNFTKTSAPGAIYCAGTVKYRYIGT